MNTFGCNWQNLSNLSVVIKQAHTTVHNLLFPCYFSPLKRYLYCSRKISSKKKLTNTSKLRNIIYCRSALFIWSKDSKLTRLLSSTGFRTSPDCYSLNSRVRLIHNLSYYSMPASVILTLSKIQSHESPELDDESQSGKHTRWKKANAWVSNEYLLQVEVVLI